MKTFLLFTLAFFFLLPSKSVAQNGNSVTPTVMEVNAYVSSFKLKEKNFPSSFSNAQNVEDLVYKLQSSVYFNSGNVKTFGDNPKNLYTDIASLNGISSVSLSKRNIEIVIIKINNSNDLNSIIDLSLCSDFYKLKYTHTDPTCSKIIFTDLYWTGKSSPNSTFTATKAVPSYT